MFHLSTRISRLGRARTSHEDEAPSRAAELAARPFCHQRRPLREMDAGVEIPADQQDPLPARLSIACCIRSK